MEAAEMPTFAASCYTTTTVPMFGAPDTSGFEALNLRRVVASNLASPHIVQNHQPRQEVDMVQKRRMVQVIVADPNENVPLDDCVLFKGEPKITDATDQELYFELDIKNLLEAHNKKRITFKDKKVKERVEMLEPAKVRDLKMVVVTIAEL